MVLLLLVAVVLVVSVMCVFCVCDAIGMDGMCCCGSSFPHKLLVALFFDDRVGDGRHEVFAFES